MEVKAEYLQAFSEEANDQLREWEQCLLTLEGSPNDKEALNDLFRAVHTLKGSAGFIEFSELQRLAHELESALSTVREGARTYRSDLGDLLFQGLDLARIMIEGFASGRPADEIETAKVDRMIEQISLPKAQGTRTAPTEAAPAVAAPIQAVQKQATPKRAAQPSLLARMVKLRNQEGACAESDAKEEKKLKTCSLAVRIEGQSREAYLRSCIVKARLEREGKIVSADPAPELLRDSNLPFAYTVTVETAQDAARLCSILAIDQVELAPVLAGPVPPSQPAGSGKATGHSATDAAINQEMDEHTPVLKSEDVVRVSVEKLDTLLNLVGELVIHNSGFVSTTQQLKSEYGKSRVVFELEEKTEALSAITRDLQEGIMKARMFPAANVFNRFKRVVRDLAKSGGKSVSFEMYGEDTEIDKKVIDRVGEPLVHLVRNAVDHGIEPAAERIACGKSETGAIRLGAYQEGDHICIEVSDDGRGLDRDAILRKALERGLIAKEDAAGATDEQILGFIFLPGFSTAKSVTDISGRGVGMDSVKRTVDEMRGNLQVKSQAGSGTTVTISVPLTMAIVSAVLVESGGSIYAIPMSAVREIVRENGSDAQTIGAQRVFLLRNEVLALVDLADALGSADGNVRRRPVRRAGEPRSARPTVIVDFQGTRIGLEVDSIVGSREVVVKSLGRHYREVDGLIGASILGNGKIALIVDVEAVVGRGRIGVNRGRTPKTAGAGPARRDDATGSRSLVPGSPGVPGLPGPTILERLARDITGDRGKLLEEINNQGAIQASMALSTLTGQEIRVSFPESKLVPITDVGELLGGDESTVGGIYVAIEGELSGGLLLVIPKNNLLLLDNLLHRRSNGTGRDLEAVDMSAISELGNILASSFINAIADGARLGVGPSVPEVGVDMCLSVIDSVLARFNQPGDKLLLTEAVIISGASETVVCHQLLFLDPDSLSRLLDSLAPAALVGASDGR